MLAWTTMVKFMVALMIEVVLIVTTVEEKILTIIHKVPTTVNVLKQKI